MVADRSTLSQLSLHTTYVYDIKSGFRLVPWTTDKQDFEMFTSNVTYPVRSKAVWPSYSPEMLHIPRSSALTCPGGHTELIRRQMQGRS